MPIKNSAKRKAILNNSFLLNNKKRIERNAKKSTLVTYFYNYESNINEGIKQKQDEGVLGFGCYLNY